METIYGCASSGGVDCVAKLIYNGGGDQRENLYLRSVHATENSGQKAPETDADELQSETGYRIGERNAETI